MKPTITILRTILENEKVKSAAIELAMNLFKTMYGKDVTMPSVQPVTFKQTEQNN